VCAWRYDDLDQRIILDDLVHAGQAQGATTSDHRTTWKKQGGRLDPQSVVDRIGGVDVDIALVRQFGSGFRGRAEPALVRCTGRARSSTDRADAGFIGSS